MGERGQPPDNIPDSRRGAVIGLMVILVLIIGGIMLVRALRRMAQIQDCAMSGRTNCTPMDSSAAGS